MNAFTTSDGLGIAYRRSGTGPALVLLHGFIADGRVWRTQIDDFSRDFDVIAWDAPGCGQSCDPPEDFSMEDYARCLLALLNDAGVEAPHLLGLSWGGTLALEFHRLFPQHVRSMIIADSYAGWTGSLGAEDAQARLDRCLRESQLPAADWIPQWVPGTFCSLDGTVSRIDLGSRWVVRTVDVCGSSHTTDMAATTARETSDAESDTASVQRQARRTNIKKVPGRDRSAVPAPDPSSARCKELNIPG